MREHGFVGGGVAAPVGHEQCRTVGQAEYKPAKSKGSDGAPQSAARRSQRTLLVVSLIVLVGMWFERFLIIVNSLARDFLPSAWGMFKPTLWDYLTFFGSIGLFIVLFMLFIRLLPMISISEMRALLPGAHGHEEGR